MTRAPGIMRRGWALGGLALSAGLMACGDGEKTEAPPPAAASKVVRAGGAQPAPAETGPQFSYSPVGKRDPFYSYLAEVEATNEASMQRKREPTETFELDQYRLTGLVTGTSQPRALVEDPEGRGHVVKLGARLGKRGGVVSRISSDAIVVTEEFRTPTGDKVRLPITIKLPQPELELVGGQ